MALNWKIPLWVPSQEPWFGSLFLRVLGLYLPSCVDLGSAPTEAPCHGTLPSPASLRQPGHAPEPAPGRESRHSTPEEEESDTWPKPVLCGARCLESLALLQLLSSPTCTVVGAAEVPRGDIAEEGLDTADCWLCCSRAVKLYPCRIPQLVPGVQGAQRLHGV